MRRPKLRPSAKGNNFTFFTHSNTILMTLPFLPRLIEVSDTCICRSSLSQFVSFFVVCCQSRFYDFTGPCTVNKQIYIIFRKLLQKICISINFGISPSSISFIISLSTVNHCYANSNYVSLLKFDPNDLF